MSVFNPDTFLDEETGGAMSTERVLIPVNTYSPCYISEVKPTEGIIGKGDRAGQPWAKLDFVWVIDSQELRDMLNRAQVKITQGVMLDLDENGRIDTAKGRNVQLGKLRKALGINETSVKFREFLGKPATIQIVHKTSNLDGSMREEVVAVAGL